MPWSELPLLLMDKVLRRLQTQDLVQLRLVCKSWKAACTEFSGSAVGRIRHQQEMFGLCAALPNLSTLALINTAADFCLSPLTACSNLEDMALQHRFLSLNEGTAPTLHFALLPMSLRRLNVSCFNLFTSGLHSPKGSFASLTSLILTWRSGDTDIMLAMWELLVDLPKLKVHCPLHSLLPSLSRNWTKTRTACFFALMLREEIAMQKLQ